MLNRRKLILALTVVFTLNIMIIALAQRADAVTYTRGSSGETVRQIQEKLLDWGYYSGEVDGIFGSKTEDAVSAYQAARDALAGSDPSGGAIYYFNPVTATNAWIWSRPEIITIGKHRFCA